MTSHRETGQQPAQPESRVGVVDTKLLHEHAEGLRHNAMIFRDSGQRARERQLYAAALGINIAGDEIDRLQSALTAAQQKLSCGHPVALDDSYGGCVLCKYRSGYEEYERELTAAQQRIAALHAALRGEGESAEGWTDADYLQAAREGDADAREVGRLAGELAAAQGSADDLEARYHGVRAQLAAEREARQQHANAIWQQGEEIVSLRQQLTAAQQHIAELESELENERARGIHTCHNQCPRPLCVANRRIRELESGLSEAIEIMTQGERLLPNGEARFRLILEGKEPS